MGEGTSRLNDGNGKSTEEPRPPREIERDIEMLRTRLDRSLAELDRRRHELTDIKLQMHRHPAVFIGAGAVVVLALGGVGYAVYRSRKPEELPAKARRLRIAFRRAVELPERDVEFLELELVAFEPPDARFRAVVSGGVHHDDA